MQHLFLLFFLNIFDPTDMTPIFTFSTQANSNEWRVVNDGVMGGVSNSSICINAAGNGQFSGHVSLDNSGGFASIQLPTRIKLSEEQQYIVLRIKGDGKRYEFRMKGMLSQAASYVHPFTTSGEWEIIRLPMKDFYPQFRGQQLNSTNFNFETIEQVGFLIANKQEEDFALLIDWIGLE